MCLSGKQKTFLFLLGGGGLDGSFWCPSHPGPVTGNDSIDHLSVEFVNVGGWFTYPDNSCQSHVWVWVWVGGWVGGGGRRGREGGGGWCGVWCGGWVGVVVWWCVVRGWGGVGWGGVGWGGVGWGGVGWGGVGWGGVGWGGVCVCVGGGGG